MTTEIEVPGRFVAIKDIVIPYKTLEKAAEEANDYKFQAVGYGVCVCKHGDNAYVIIEKLSSDNALAIGCNCSAWKFAHDQDGCKHVATLMKRSSKPTAELDKDIARDLMAAGWTGGKGNLRPPGDEAELDGRVNTGTTRVMTAPDKGNLHPPGDEDTKPRKLDIAPEREAYSGPMYVVPPETTSDPEGEGSDLVPPETEKPEPGMIIGTCEWCGGTIRRKRAPDLKRAIEDHKKTCPKRPKEQEQESDSAKNAPTETNKPKEEPKMAKETKTYTHPDGTEFESAEALFDYVDTLKAEHAAETTQQQTTFKLAPMIKGIVPQMRERGRITIGKKGTANASGRGRMPVKFDHFVFTTTDKDEKTDDYILDTEMNERYGDNCREIPVRFLSDDITEIFATFYAKYTASGIKLRGDGENWIVYNADGTRDYIEDPNGERGFLNDPDVKPHGILTVLVDGQGGVGSVYRFRTTGRNSINGMLSSLALCAKIAQRAGGRIAFLPMMLVYSTKWVTPAGQATKKKIPVVTCEFRGSIEELQERSREAMQYLSAPGSENIMQLRDANVYDPEGESVETQQDLAAEFGAGVE